MSDEVKATAEAVVETAEAKKYSVEELQKQLKPLSNNGFVRFFQKIWRWWLGVWYGFCDKHPKGSSILQKAFFFIVFSEGVTIWQFIVMTFLPYAFTGIFPNVDGGVGWPAVTLSFASNNGASYVIFGDANSWAYFIAFEIAVFTAHKLPPSKKHYFPFARKPLVAGYVVLHRLGTRFYRNKRCLGLH